MNGCFRAVFGDACALASSRYSPTLPYDAGKFFFGRAIAAFRRICGEGFPAFADAKNSCLFRCCSSRFLRAESCSWLDVDWIFFNFLLCAFKDFLLSNFFAACLDRGTVRWNHAITVRRKNTIVFSKPQPPRMGKEGRKSVQHPHCAAHMCVRCVRCVHTVQSVRDSFSAVGWTHCWPGKNKIAVHVFRAQPQNKRRWC